ncbi:Phosphomannomutase [Synechocystis sp. PCC 6803]|nr:Phosphomannomutase [Synechocystis sp. PCC 6803] [Bacillus subtilis BEST7613]
MPWACTGLIFKTPPIRAGKTISQSRGKLDFTPRKYCRWPGDEDGYIGENDGDRENLIVIKIFKLIEAVVLAIANGPIFVDSPHN